MIRWLSLSLILLACGKGTNRDAEPAPVLITDFAIAEHAWQDKLISVDVDPAVHTAGTIRLKMPAPDMSAQVVVVREAESSEPGMEALSALIPICRDMEFLQNADEALISWRSRFDVDDLARVSRHLEQNVRFSCGLLLTSERLNETFLIRLDPFPVEGTRQYFGAHDIQAAINGQVPLFFDQTERSPQVFVVQSQSTLGPSKAVTALQAQLNVESYPDYQCSTVDFEGPADLKNSGHVLWNEITLGDSPALIKKIGLSRESEGYSYCKSIRVRQTGRSLTLGMDCTAYEQMIQDHYCQFLITVANAADPLNTLALPYSFPKADHQILSGLSPEGAAVLIPPDSQNPVRQNKIEFDPSIPLGMRSGIEKSLDLWSALDPVNFQELVPELQKIAFGSHGACTTNVRAYVDPSHVGTVFICETYFLDQQNYVTLALTLFHEVLHLKGKMHDRDQPAYVSCTAQGGTSFAAKLVLDLYSCQEPYCLGYRALARNEFMLEMYYNLGGDYRIYADTCRTWANQMGVVF